VSATSRQDEVRDRQSVVTDVKEARQVVTLDAGLAV